MLSFNLIRIFSGWKLVNQHAHVKSLNHAILEEWSQLKYRKKLFLRWVYSLRQSSKIKRKALSIVGYGSNTNNHSSRSASNVVTLNDEHWFKAALNKTQERFKNAIKEHLIERKQVSL